MKMRTTPWVTALSAIVLSLASASDAAGQGSCDGVSPVSNTNLTRIAVATGLTAGNSGPLFVTAPPGDVTRIFIVLQNGVIRQLRRGDGPTTHTVFLDIDARVGSTANEQGLLGLAFGPTFAADGYFYVKYTRDDGDTIVSRFRTLDGTAQTNGDPASETVLLRIDQLQNYHIGGWMSFGTDGFLYIAQGDDGDGDGVACGNSQSLGTLLGKILRIDPTGTIGTAPDCGLDAATYSIPPGNPFVDGSGSGNCDEIWSYGLRNPWRNSFDAATGDLLIGDVGEECWEEIDWTPGTSTGGENYGWRLFEGRHCFNAMSGCFPTGSPFGCGPACIDPAPAGDALPNGTTLPIWEYASNGGLNCSVVGGYVYRGCRMPNFRGKYFYGDFCTGSVLSFEAVGGVATNHQSWTAQLGAGLGFDLTSFGTDAQGELYVVDRDGIVYLALPPLPDFEVSGAGAADQFRLSRNGDWTWENLQVASWQPITSYSVYRASIADGVFNPGEIFDCVKTSASPVWPAGGDLVNPGIGGMFAYVVTAKNGGAEQTSPGGSPVRTLSAIGCP